MYIEFSKDVSFTEFSITYLAQYDLINKIYP